MKERSDDFDAYRSLISVTFACCTGTATDIAVALRPRMVIRVLVNIMMVFWFGGGKSVRASLIVKREL